MIINLYKQEKGAQNYGVPLSIGLKYEVDKR